MNLSERLRQLECGGCGWRKVFGPEEMAERLRTVGKLRREAKPEWQMVFELFRLEAQNISCSSCGQQEMKVGPVSDDFDDWGQAKKCEVCKANIPPERLEIFPESTRCAKCQDAPSTERDFCDFCGGVMQISTSRGPGISRYRAVCSDCGRS